MSYFLKIYENSHYADENEAYTHGSYASYSEAERTAKGIVRDFLQQNWSKGKKEGILLAEYTLYGEDPVILPAENPEGRKFSARNYASEIVGAICEEREHDQRQKEVQTLYLDALSFAAGKHQEKKQTVKGTNLPYAVHLSNVAMEIFMAAGETKEFNLPYAIQVALLHDTLEDTGTTSAELEELFGKDIARGVRALTKDEAGLFAAEDFRSMEEADISWSMILKLI